MISRKRGAVSGLLTDIGGQVLTTAVSFVVTPIILAYISQTLYGFWVTVLSVLVYLGLVDVGLGISLTRIAAGLSDRSDATKMNRVVSTAFCSFCLLGLVFLLVGFAIAKYVPVWFKIPRMESEEIVSAYKILVLSGAIALPLSTFNAIIAGIQRISFNNIVQTLSLLAGYVVSLVLLLLGYGILGLAISNLICVLISGTVSYYWCRYRYYPDLRLSPLQVNRHDLRALWSFGGYYQLGRIAYMITSNADAILIASLLGAVAVPPYTLTSKIAVLISFGLASKLPISAFPALSSMFAKNELCKLRQAYVGLAFFSTRLAIVSGVLLALVNRQFVSLWVGPEYFAGHALNLVFISWVLLDTIFRGTGIVVVASGQLKGWAMANAMEAVLNVAISIMLAKPLGLVGIALGTTLSRLMTTDICVPIIACRRIGLPFWTFLYRGVIRPASACLPGCVLVTVLAQFAPRDCGWAWLFAIGFAALFVNVLTFEGMQIFRMGGLPLMERLRKLAGLEYVLG